MFSGDTKISLVNGTELTLTELINDYGFNKSFGLYCYNENNYLTTPTTKVVGFCGHRTCNDGAIRG